MDDAIILRNIRLDIRVVKPLIRKVLLSQKHLLKTLQDYKELTSKAGYNEEEANKLLWRLWRLDQQQRAFLAELRELEEKSTGVSCSGRSLLCLEELGDNSPIKDETENAEHIILEAEPTVVQSLEFRITGSAIIRKSGGFSNEDSMEIILEPCDSSTSDSVASFHQSEEPSTVAEEQMEQENLKLDSMSDMDDLLQRIERLGSRATEEDFLAAIGLVHKSNYAQAEKKLAEEKLLRSDGKKITTGPWQIMDIPTKVTSRRSNYLSSNYLVTVRQRDPYRHVPAPSSSVESGVKTRNQESSRTSSRTSSRASSPVSGSRVDSRELTGALYNSRANNLVKARAARAQRRKAKVRLGSNVLPKPVVEIANNSSGPTAKQISRVVPMLSSGVNALPLKSLATPVMINNSVSITPVVPQASRPPLSRKRSDSSESGIVFLPLNKVKQTAGSSSASPAGPPPMKKPAWTVAVSSDGTPVYNVHYEEPTPSKEAKTVGSSFRFSISDKPLKETDKALKPKPSNTDKGKEQQSSDASPSAAGKPNTPQALGSGKVLYFPFKERMKSFSFTPTSTTTTSSSAAAKPAAAPQQQSAASAQAKKPVAATPISLLKPIIIMPGSKSPSGTTYIPLQSINKGRPAALMQLSTLMKNNIRPGKILTTMNKLGAVSVRPAAPQVSPPQVEEQSVQQQQSSKAQSSKDATTDIGPTIIVADMSS